MVIQEPDYECFVNELRKIQLAINNTPTVFPNVRELVSNSNIEKAVNSLEPILKEMRSTAEITISGKILKYKHNDPDNPLFSTVSLYGSMDIGRLEVAHTNTLAWLLNPYAEHGFDSLLKALLAHLDQTSHWPQHFELIDVSVTSEHVISTGRVDVWAEGRRLDASTGITTPWLIVIECKIDHSVADNQLEKYEDEVIKWKKENHGEAFYVFLTPDKHETETGKVKWEPLSFEDLFVIFWKQAKYLEKEPGYQFLRLYLAGILKDVQRLAIPIGNQKSSPYEALVLFNKLTREEILI